MKVQKIVSLDVETAQIAQNMGNFSLFVREQLHATKSEDTIKDMEKRIAVYVKAYRTLVKEITKERMLSGHPKGHMTDGEMEKWYIDQAREELFQARLGDY